MLKKKGSIDTDFKVIIVILAMVFAFTMYLVAENFMDNKDIDKLLGRVSIEINYIVNEIDIKSSKNTNLENLVIEIKSIEDSVNRLIESSNNAIDRKDNIYDIVELVRHSEISLNNIISEIEDEETKDNLEQIKIRLANIDNTLSY